MSREIKFRCWSNEEGQYFPVQIVNFVDNKPISVGYHKKGHKGFLHMRLPKFILEQYTGLTDKNGKEIYEGDIITETIDDGSNNIIQMYEVFWDEDMLNFGIRGTKGFNYNLHDDLWETNASREVIGNIHENLELIGDEE